MKIKLFIAILLTTGTVFLVTKRSNYQELPSDSLEIAQHIDFSKDMLKSRTTEEVKLGQDEENKTVVEKESPSEFFEFSSEIADMTFPQIKEEIQIIEEMIDKDDVIRRLNEDFVSEEDRKYYGMLFARVVQLKSRVLTAEIESLNSKLQSIEANHDQKLVEMNRLLSRSKH